jgi:hypothetical protein
VAQLWFTNAQDSDFLTYAGRDLAIRSYRVVNRERLFTCNVFRGGGAVMALHEDTAPAGFGAE